jgi:hypothetical protein
MGDWLKSLGQLFGGIGLFVAALVYLLNFQRESADQKRKLRGRLLLIGAELDSHERALTRYLA